MEMQINNRPVFSVIMPCYNSESYVQAAVDSVVSQKFDSWELIAVNDGSQDDTLSILNRYASSDKRIHVYSKENGGYCSAINYGLDRISGEYFLFMGSDDILSEDLFLELDSKLGDRRADIIGFRAVCVIDGSMYKPDNNSNFQTYIYEENCSIVEFERKYPQHSEIFFIRDTSKCFKTELLDDLRYYGKYGYDADGIFSMQIARKARSFMCVPINGYYWTLRSDSLSGRVLSQDVHFDRLIDWKLFFENIEKLSRSELTQHEINYLSRFYGIARTLSKTVKLVQREKANTLCNTIHYINRLACKWDIHFNDSFISKMGSKVFMALPKLWLLKNG